MSDPLIPMGLFVAIVGVLGLVVGSFLNVVIHRVPMGMSVVSPGSSCPVCHSPVRAHDNVPVVSWLLLRGRCRDCAAPIAARYPLVELATAVLFAVSAWRLGPSVYLGAVIVLMAGGVALFMIDLDHQRLPFSITGLVAVGVVAAMAVAAAAGNAGHVTPALLSTALWLAVYGGIHLVTRGRGMGLGDVALAPVLGLVLGWSGWGPSLVGLLAGFTIGAVVGVGLLVSGRAGARSRVPHGPFLLTGAVVGLFVGQPLWHDYLRLFGLG
ncbi:MAG: peptidase domain protein [Aeromicrobium sp.]|jgi:leader peptidase (prepilin peptidase)/N-methyltransferase|nr:peptidase domain protein [Aeromicrobium sp.]